MGERIEIRLEVDPDSDPIAGQVHGRDGGGYGFRGWTQLMAAVDAARTPETDDEAPESSPTGDGRGRERRGEPGID